MENDFRCQSCRDWIKNTSQTKLTQVGSSSVTGGNWADLEFDCPSCGNCCHQVKETVPKLALDTDKISIKIKGSNSTGIGGIITYEPEDLTIPIYGLVTLEEAEELIREKIKETSRIRKNLK